MSTDTIVKIDVIFVMYVAGQAGISIEEQAPEAFKKLEAKLSSFRGRKFYGVIIGHEYRACVAMESNADTSSLSHPTWTIPGGNYVRRKIQNWEDNLKLIGPIFEKLCQRSDVDTSRPCIEYYRSQKELLLMVPVQ